MTGVEVPGIYDGVCFYLCQTCGVWRHRFARSDDRRAKVALYIEQAQIVPKVVVKHDA